jgi:hypothetical protein
MVAVMTFSTLEPKQNIERALHRRLAHSIEDVVDLSGLGRTMIFAAIKQRRLIARKCGRRTLILDEDLLKWLQTLPVVKPEIPASSISKEGRR